MLAQRSGTESCALLACRSCGQEETRGQVDVGSPVMTLGRVASPLAVKAPLPFLVQTRPASTHALPAGTLMGTHEQKESILPLTPSKINAYEIRHPTKAKSNRFRLHGILLVALGPPYTGSRAEILQQVQAEVY